MRQFVVHVSSLFALPSSHCSPISGWGMPSPQRGQSGPKQSFKRQMLLQKSSLIRLPSSHSSVIPRTVSITPFGQRFGHSPSSGHTPPPGQISPGSQRSAQNDPRSTVTAGHASSSFPASNLSGGMGSRMSPACARSRAKNARNPTVLPTPVRSYSQHPASKASGKPSLSLSPPSLHAENVHEPALQYQLSRSSGSVVRLFGPSSQSSPSSTLLSPQNAPPHCDASRHSGSPSPSTNKHWASPHSE